MREHIGGLAGTPLDAGVPKPPAWLMIATAVLTVACLAMAVAETTLWLHYFIDAGEYISLAGLVFILIAGCALYRRGRLFVSLPLVFPWLLYPVITQGDEIIDNLSINAMRAICQVLLVAIFATPVAVIGMAARYAFLPRAGQAMRRARWVAWVPGVNSFAAGRSREGTVTLVVALLALELGIAHLFLGTLMVVSLIVTILAVLAYGSLAAPPSTVTVRRGGERFAMVILLAGVAASLSLYVGFKNRPGVYQGSPSVFMDPANAQAGYALDRIPVSTQPLASGCGRGGFVRL